MRALNYQKWNGTGNDFAIFICSSEADLWVSNPENVRRICDRTHGIGADGVVLLHAYLATSFGLRTDIINNDGTSVEMCGNALRCIAKLAQPEGLGQVFRMGDREIRAQFREDGQATVCLGSLENVGGHELFESLDALDELLGHRGYLLSFGNPHYVVPVASIPGDWAEQGAKCQELADSLLGTGGINLGWLETGLGSGEIPKLCVYERGVGVTESCGSGACAASATLRFLGGPSEAHQLELPGGVLTVSVTDDEYYLTGDAFCESTGSWEENAF